MKYASMLAVLMLAGCAAPEAPPPPPPADTKPHIDPAFMAEVRELVRRTGKRCGFDIVEPYREQLLQLGEKAFPVYEAILADPQTDERMVFLTCMAIERIKVDRRRFVPLLVKRITAPDAMYVSEERGHPTFATLEEQARQRQMYESHTRNELANLLVEIGDERDAAALAPYLTSEIASLRRVAARVLCAFGSHADLEAMNAILKRGIPGADVHEIRDLTQCRDQLAKRLKDHPIPKNLTD